MVLPSSQFPLCSHAPLSDPGGVLSTRPNALRTRCPFQCVETVGLPPLYTFRGSITRPTSRYTRLRTALCGKDAGSLLTCWLDVIRWDLHLGARPLGNNNHFMGFHPIPRFRAYLGATRL